MCAIYYEDEVLLAKRHTWGVKSADTPDPRVLQRVRLIFMTVNPPVDDDRVFVYRESN